MGMSYEEYLKQWKKDFLAGMAEKQRLRFEYPDQLTKRSRAEQKTAAEAGAATIILDDRREKNKRKPKKAQNKSTGR